MEAPCDVALLGTTIQATAKPTVPFSKVLHQVAGLLASMLLTLAWPGTVCAQSVENVTANGNELGQASLEELLNMKVYSASRYSQPVSQAPASVTIVTHEEIERYGYRTLGDLLRSVPGFYVPYDRLYGYVGVRGFANPGDYNTRVLLLVDGHRVNDSIYQQATLGTEFPVDIDMVERVEVIRGPASSLYGTNAVFGVINVITRTPHELAGWRSRRTRRHSMAIVGASATVAACSVSAPWLPQRFSIARAITSSTSPSWICPHTTTVSPATPMPIVLLTFCSAWPHAASASRPCTATATSTIRQAPGA